MVLKSFITVLMLSVTLMAGAQKKFKTTPNGLKYIIYTANKGEKPKVGDMIKFHFILSDSKDSVLISSYKSMIPPTTVLQKPFYKGDLFEAFGMMAKGDSALFLVSADSFYKGQTKMPAKSGSMLNIMIKMLDVVSSGGEAANLEKYIKEKEPRALKTNSGLYYVIETEGTGLTPRPGQTVQAHYAGTFLDGKEFDSDHGAGFSFVLGQHQVIEGWDEGFALLKKGSKAKFIIPSSLAYGPQGDGRIIPAFSTLIFEVELVDFK
jgi:FKBP-type peptidyl-prolyl cis-trans isomerase FkpA